MLREINWESNAAEWGHATGENTVSIARYTGGNLLCSASGSTPEEMAVYIKREFARWSKLIKSVGIKLD